MLENLSFTDAQGQMFTDAVVRVQTASLNTNSSDSTYENLTIDNSDYSKPAIVENNDNSYTNIDLNAQFVYWASKESFDAGLQPYPLTFKREGHFTSNLYLNNVELSDEKYTGLSLEEKCELYFTDSILPTLTPIETP
ncbi:conserved hypothetical protein [Alteromonas alvinellae]